MVAIGHRYRRKQCGVRQRRRQFGDSYDLFVRWALPMLAVIDVSASHNRLAPMRPPIQQHGRRRSWHWRATCGSREGTRVYSVRARCLRAGARREVGNQPPPFNP